MAPSATTTITQYEALTINSNITDLKYTASDTVQRHYGAKPSKDIVTNALKQRVENIDTDVCLAGEEDAFFVADMGHIYRQHMRWKKNLKRVKPHYGTLRLFEVFKVKLTQSSREVQSGPRGASPTGGTRYWL